MSSGSSNGKTIVREMKKLAAMFNCEVTDIAVGKHFKFYMDTPTGKQILVCSRSVSDRRALANNTTLLKQWSRV